MVTYQETNPLSAFPSKNVTYNIHRFAYGQSVSMAGVFFFDSSGNPCFNFMRPYPFLNLPKPNFFNIPTPFTILSSSQGLLLCRDFQNHNYHVCNPFVQSPHSYRLIPTPSRSHDFCPASVLSTDLRKLGEPRFYITCIVEEKRDAGSCLTYTFDVYSSSDDQWLIRTNQVETERAIAENSGVSSPDGSVYWLTEAPHQIVKYQVNRVIADFSKVFGLPEGFTGEHVKLSLGRMGVKGIAMVALRCDELVLFLLNDGFTDANSWQMTGTLNVSGILSPEKIEFFRFEGDVALWVGDRIAFWAPTVPFHIMPEWVDVPGSISDAVPYVNSSIVPVQFPNAGLMKMSAVS